MRESRIEFVYHEVEKYSGVNKKLIRDKSRVREVAIPRQVFAYILRVYLNMSLKEVGMEILKDHSAISYYISKHEDHMFYPPYARLYTSVVDALSADSLKYDLNLLNEKIKLAEIKLLNLKNRRDSINKKVEKNEAS